VIGWDAVNLSFAPYLTGMGEGEIEQFAQMLIYEFSQLTSARGGQAIFTDIHLYWEVPPSFSHLPAVGPGGKPTGRPYRDYREESQRFARALMTVYREGMPRESRSSSHGRSSISRMNSSERRVMRHFLKKLVESPPRRGIPASPLTGRETLLTLFAASSIPEERGPRCFGANRGGEVSRRSRTSP